MSKYKLNKKLCLILCGIFALLLLLVELYNFKHFTDTWTYEIVYGILSRMLGAAICIVLMIYSRFEYLFSFKNLSKFGILLILPCLLISINNFPFVPVLSGEISLSTLKWYMLLVYAIQCFFVGLFEETAFRGCVFMLMLEKRHKTRADIFWSIVFSSLVFGAIHIVNLFAGGGIVPVILQLGYSFLIGAMCAVILIFTRNIWFSVFAHALFNFAGGFIPQFVAGVKLWTNGEIILTVVVSLAVAVYTVLLFFKYDLNKMQRILEPQSK